MSARMKKVRHTRILDIRKKIELGWKMPDLVSYCLINLGVSKPTATSYIDEAAEPFRKKHEADKK